MSRPLQKLVIATHNAGKLREMRELLAPYGVEAVSAGELGLPEPDETGANFVENALIKARAAAQGARAPGACRRFGPLRRGAGRRAGHLFRTLGGRIQGFRRGHGPDRATRSRSLDRRRAAATSSRPWLWSGPTANSQTFEGKVFGDLTFPTRGTQGFGYDPCFTPDGHTRTFGEMSAEEKHGVPADGSQALSHRARAFQMLAASLFGRS